MRLESSYHRALPYRLRSMLHNQSRSLCKLVVHFLNRKGYLLIILEFSKRFSLCIPFLLSHKKLVEILKMMNLFGVSMVQLLNDRFCRVIQKLNFGFFKSERTLGSWSFTLLLNQYLSLSVIGIFYLLKLFHPQESLLLLLFFIFDLLNFNLLQFLLICVSLKDEFSQSFVITSAFFVVRRGVFFGLKFLKRNLLK